MSARYLQDRFLPDKAIDVIDEAGARARIGSMTRPTHVKDKEKAIAALLTQRNEAIQAEQFEEAAKLRDEERKARAELETELAEWRKSHNEKIVEVTEEDVRLIVSKWTGVPLEKMEQKETAKLLEMESVLHEDGHRAGGCHFVHLQGAAPFAGGPEGSAAADRLVHLPGADGRGQDAAGEIAGGIHVQQPRGADPDRHVGIHGEVQRLAAGRVAARLRGLRGGRPAHRARAPPARIPSCCSTRSRRRIRM